MRLAGVFTAAVLAAASFWACGSDDKEKDKETTAPATTTYTFATHVNPIIKKSCVNNGGCHEVTGNTGKKYEDNEATFKAQCTAAGAGSAAQTIATRMNGTTGGTQMPQSPKTITDADKKILIDFCAQ